jgi:hypothetical protein
MISGVIARRPGAVGLVSAQLWRELAQQLGAIVGESGFWSLYLRSLHLCGALMPWLAQALPDAALPLAQALHFEALGHTLATQEPTEARHGSVALLATFIDLLASLIGERLTIQILHSAWGDDVVDLTVKEPSK